MIKLESNAQKATKGAGVPVGWDVVDFENCLQKIRLGREKQIPTKEYLANGKFPIVDQGQKIIAGFTNNESKVITENLPFIIFGDHTRIVKYIDFPLALGADGTKLIKPNENFNTAFFYFQLLFIDIPARGYNRHYTLLKEKKIVQPPLSEQQSIAETLSSVQTAISEQKNMIKKLRELKRSMMHELFTCGTRGEKVKMTDIGEIPENWELSLLGDIVKTSSGGTPSRRNKEYYHGNIPWIKSGELNDGVVYDSEEKINEIAVKSSSAKIFHSGTLLVAMYGATIGKTAILGVDGTTNQAICGIFKSEKTSNIFLQYLLIFRKDELIGQGHGGAQPNISQTVIRNLPIALPKLDEQIEIAEILSSIDKRIEIQTEKLNSLESLFQTLLHELMSGERRVNNIL